MCGIQISQSIRDRELRYARLGDIAKSHIAVSKSESGEAFFPRPTDHTSPLVRQNSCLALVAIYLFWPDGDGGSSNAPSVTDTANAATLLI